MATKNTGERDELIAALKLTEMRDRGLSFNRERITSVGYAGREYGALPTGIDINSLKSRTNDELDNLSRRAGITKAGASLKADIYINMIPYSLKSTRSAPPAIVNHTARPGFEAVCIRINTDILQLDEMVEQYWELRNVQEIGEDIINRNPVSPFRAHKEYLRNILNYFLFTGTARGNSAHPAEYIININDPFEISTWKIYNRKNALDVLWDNLIFSMRADKGMPPNYPHLSRRLLPKKSSYEKWTRFIDNEYRGALHIRSR